MVGLLHTPNKEGSSGDEFADKFPAHISFRDLEDGVDWTFKKFKSKVKRMFTNIIQWHSEHKFIPDNDLDDIRNLDIDGIRKAKTKYTKTDAEFYTIRTILEENDIPKEFEEVTRASNAMSFSALKT